MDHVESNIVVLQKLKQDAENHLRFVEVPTLDFLLRKRIIPKTDDWDAEDTPPGDMPFNKMVRFTNGVQITSSFDRFIVFQDMLKKPTLDDSKNIAVRILNKIADVDYGGAGFNFLSIQSFNDPGLEVQERFLKHIPGLPEDLVGGSFSYLYDMDNARVTVQVGAVKRLDESALPETAVAVRSNYHFDVPHIKRIVEFIDNIDKYKDDYLKEVNRLFR